MSRIAETALSEYNRARTNEEDVAHSLNTLKGDVTKTNQPMVRLRELESEAESDRAVYAAFLNRAKEVGEQQDLDKPIRASSRAPWRHREKRAARILIIAGSLVFGLLAAA